MILSRDLRLTEAFHYNIVKKYGKSFHGDFLIISVLKDIKEATHPSIFGILITNKVDKRSVERHRLKRIISRCIRENKEKFRAEQFFVVVIAKGIIAGKNYEEISTDFNKALSKVSFA
jgi:ribonuclease P protein component